MNAIEGLAPNASVRAVAMYLPQFHPIPENDEWWGKGFTEWTNTAKAKPLFRGHYQPHVPADLGFYDLRVPETRQEQADLARAYGIEAFCYYHYWFAGRQLLQRPLQEVVASGKPDFPFCICWANQTWSGIWHGLSKRILIEQTYPGREDHEAHFQTLLPAFRDNRYLRVDEKPVFIIYEPTRVPESRATTDLWRDLAVRAGLKGLYLIAWFPRQDWDAIEHGYDATVRVPPVPLRPWVSRRHPIRWAVHRFLDWIGRPNILSFAQIMEQHRRAYVPKPHPQFPCVMHAFDNTPRSGKRGVVIADASPAMFRTMLREAIAEVACYAPQERLVFLKSWNEWAEGNHLEPDLRDGHAYLRVLKDVLDQEGATRAAGIVSQRASGPA